MTKSKEQSLIQVNEIIKGVTITVVALFIAWISYTVVDTSSKVSLNSYKLTQIQSDIKDIKELLKKK